jgi:hypothetical protein
MANKNALLSSFMFITNFFLNVSLSVFFIYKPFASASERTIYSVSEVDLVTDCCCLDVQTIGPEANKILYTWWLYESNSIFFNVLPIPSNPNSNLKSSYQSS